MTEVNTAPAAAEAPSLDAKNPWLGLASFTEETRAYFYGREDEVAELGRRVQRKLLTVLFGQSGLGKTSILRAGLVPRLRGQGYCPVYVRIDYGRDAPEPAVQIKAAIAATARRSGEWTQAGVAVEGESLWEFLHHRDDVLRDEAGNTLIPLLIFDQFEEIFTLAQSDDFGRARAARFIADLSDLVENRPPKELEAKLENDDQAAESFDFARSDYRVLISLREDYLAPLEGLKASMPSITQNRLRLAPMTGAQALEAVMRPGGKLVNEDVAAAIVRFVAGGAEIANAEVEPSLLSLICRELNDKRLAEGRAEISLDLLAGSHATILAEFYERALIDQPVAVRRVIEDELLTESGYRENIAEERIVSLFAAAGAAPGTLPLLVNRRLLRIEERLDVRRVELTHDVLCAVVKGSRDLRYEREARDRTEKLLSEQRDREIAARQSLAHARKIAAGCAALALCAVVALGFAYVSARRAHDSRVAAETARSQAEHLLGYLNDDFAVELAGFGTLGLVKQLGAKETEYYDSLPASLQTQDTRRSAARARVRYGIAQQQSFDLNGARESLTNAVNTLEQLRKDGDTTEESAISLAIGLAALADVTDRSGTGADPDVYNSKAEAVLRPYADAPDSSVAARRAYGQVTMSVASYMSGEPALALYQRAAKALESIGALSLTDLSASADYATVLQQESLELWRMGRIADLKKVADQGMQLSNDILAQRPGHIVALQARMALNTLASSPPEQALHVAESIQYLDRAYGDGQVLLRLDPANVDTRGAVATNRDIASSNAERLGRPREALQLLQTAIDIDAASAHGVADKGASIAARQGRVARFYAELGEREARDAAMKDAAATVAEFIRARGADNRQAQSAENRLLVHRAFILLMDGDPKKALKLTDEVLPRLMARPAPGPLVGLKIAVVGALSLVRAEAQMRLGEFDAARKTAADAATLATTRDDVDSRNMHANLTVWASIAASRQGETAQARELVTPIFEWQRERYAKNFDDARQRLEYATAVYALALADASRHDALLRQAASIIAALPAEMRSLRSVRDWQDRVAAEIARPVRVSAASAPKPAP